jgi:hypothetical protein
MGTRSYIAIANPKGGYSAIYCHWDGYPDYMGAMLRDHYGSKGKSRALIRLGDCSSIKRNLSAVGPHTFDAPADDVTIAYGRDRGETNCKARNFTTVKELAAYAADTWAQYVYVFDGKRWHWCECDKAGRGPFQTLI